MPEPGEPTGVNPDNGVKLQGHETKYPTERLLLLGQLTEHMVGNTKKIIKKQLEEDDGRLGESHKSKMRQQVEELDFLLSVSARIQNGEPFMPVDLKNAPGERLGTATLRLVREGSKLRTADRGGQTILNLQYVKAREGQSSLDQAYSQGLGRDPEKVVDHNFTPQAQETIFINTLFAYMDSTGKVRSRPRAGYAISYNQGENTEGVPTAKVGAVIYSGNVPYIAGTSMKIFMPQFEQIKNVITSGGKIRNP